MKRPLRLAVKLAAAASVRDGGAMFNLAPSDTRSGHMGGMSSRGPLKNKRFSGERAGARDGDLDHYTIKNSS